MQNFEISGSVDDELKRIGTYGEEENIIKIKTIFLFLFAQNLTSLFFIFIIHASFLNSVIFCSVVFFFVVLSPCHLE